MALETATLDNGLNIYVDRVAGSKVNTASVVVPYGSINEETSDEGVAHAFEHCVHLKTDKFQDMYALDQYDDLNGLETNANTTHTRTLYYANGLELEPCMVHLGQILRHTHFPQDMVENEMKAIRREAVTRLDEVLLMHLMSSKYAMFGNPYGRSVAGYHDKLNFGADKLKRLHAQHYALANMALVVTGAAKLDEVAALANRYFENDGDRPKPPRQELAVSLGEACLTGFAREDSNSVRVSISYPMTEQFRHRYNDNRLAINVASEVISNKAFRSLRYDKGISYSSVVFVDSRNHPNAWSLGGMVTTDAENVGIAKQVFDDIFSSTSADYADEDIAGVLAKAKYYMCRDANSPDSRASSHISRLESYRQPVDIRSDMRQLKKLKIEDVRSAIDDIVALTSSSAKYTHLTGKRQDIGEVERIIDQSEFA